MKKVTICLVLLLQTTIFVHAQNLSPKTSYLGLTGEASHYWLYNKKEFNAPDNLFGVKNDSVFVNGYAFGISYGHFFTKRFGIELQLLYSDQTQYYRYIRNPDFPGFYTAGHTNLQYLRLPIILKRRFTASNNSFFSYYSGLQFSFLTKAVDYYENYVDLAEYESAVIIHENDNFQKTDIYGVVHLSEAEYMDWRYHRFSIELNFGLQYEYFLSNWLSLYSSVFSSIGLTNIDNTGALSYERIFNEGNPDGYLQATPRWREYRSGSLSYSHSYDRSSSHNIHLGIQVGVKFWFGSETINVSAKKGRPLNW